MKARDRYVKVRECGTVWQSRHSGFVRKSTCWSIQPPSRSIAANARLFWMPASA